MVYWYISKEKVSEIASNPKSLWPDFVDFKFKLFPGAEVQIHENKVKNNIYDDLKKIRK